jgi:hypothetical protein
MLERKHDALNKGAAPNGVAVAKLSPKNPLANAGS